MRRGDIYLVDLEPVRGNEANKRRPAVVVSNNRANLAALTLQRGVVTVVPLTSAVTRVYPFQTLLPAGESGLKFDSKAQAEQVRTVSVNRLTAVVGHVPGVLMAELDAALRLHLDL